MSNHEEPKRKPLQVSHGSRNEKKAKTPVLSILIIVLLLVIIKTKTLTLVLGALF